MQKAESSDISVLKVSDLRHEEHRKLLSHWLEHRRGTDVPLRKSLDPTAFPELLPLLAILQSEEGEKGPDYRFRLAGTEIVARAGFDPTGKSFEELYHGEYLRTAKLAYMEITETGLPYFSYRIFPIADGQSALRYDRLILPYSSDGTTIDQFLLQLVVLGQDTPQKLVGSFSIFGAD